RKPARRQAAKPAPNGDTKGPAVSLTEEGKPAKKSDEERRQEALDLIVGTVEALVAERGGEEKIWGSMVKQALKRRKPGFTESYHGFRSFNALLEAAEKSGRLKLD